MGDPNFHCCMDEREDLNHFFRLFSKAQYFCRLFEEEDFLTNAHIFPFSDRLAWNLKVNVQGDKGYPRKKGLLFACGGFGSGEVRRYSPKR